MSTRPSRSLETHREKVERLDVLVQVKQEEIDRLYRLLGRIHEAHAKDVDAHGGTSGYCVECGRVWPCPTYAWSENGDRDPLLDCWDPADDTDDNDAAERDAAPSRPLHEYADDCDCNLCIRVRIEDME